ncbi:MAG: MFS transporter [Isosphaeraceae bacterium]
MDWRNRIGLYGAYFFGMAGIGFTLPYLPLYLKERGLSDREIGIISTLAALSALAQFVVGLWSDRIGRHRPFLLVSLGVLALATWALPRAPGGVWLAVAVVLFAENGICRAIAESQSGAEAVALAGPGQVGRSLGALRFWKPIGIVLILLLGGWMAEKWGVGSILAPLAVVQSLALVSALLIRESKPHAAHADDPMADEVDGPGAVGTGPAGNEGRDYWRDPALWSFIAAMVLFHAANAPGGVYLGLFLSRDLHATAQQLAIAFVVSMAAWMLVVRPAGTLADRWGRRPLLIVAWAVMAARLGIVAVARNAGEVVAIQALDGLANGLFAVLAAAWVTDRLGGARRAGEAQAIVGTSLVFGSALGPYLSALWVETLGYRGLFGVLAGVGAAATLLVLFAVPESLARDKDEPADHVATRLPTLAAANLAPGESPGA